MKALLASALLTLTAASSASAQACAEGERLFSHARGETCILAEPQRIASLRGDTVTTPLMDIGAPVIATVMRQMDDGSTFVRGASDIFGQDAVDAAGFINLGGHNTPDIEAVAAAYPDLIILRSYQADAIDQLSAIAPAIVVPDNMPLTEHLGWLADAAGMSDSYDGDLARYRARIAEAQEVIGSPEEITVSRFDMWDDGLWFYPNWGAVDQVIDDIGFSRPANQAEAEEGISGLSFERIAEFDGDILISSRAPRFGQTIVMLTEQWDNVAPFWRDLSGVQAGNHFWYERDVWVGHAFASLDRVIDGMILITAGRGLD